MEVGAIRPQRCCSDRACTHTRTCACVCPAAVVKTDPGTEQPQRHTELYCPYNDASVTL